MNPTNVPLNQRARYRKVAQQFLAKRKGPSALVKRRKGPSAQAWAHANPNAGFKRGFGPPIDWRLPNSSPNLAGQMGALKKQVVSSGGTSRDSLSSAQASTLQGAMRQAQTQLGAASDPYAYARSKGTGLPLRGDVSSQAQAMWDPKYRQFFQSHGGVKGFARRQARRRV